MNDRWIKCISASGTLRAVAIRSTGLVRELAALQKLSPHGSEALGEALVGGMLIGSFCKPGEHANLNVRGDGIVKQALVDAYPDGTVRGYVVENPNHKSQPGKKLKLAPEAKLAVGEQTFTTAAGEFVIDLSLTSQEPPEGPWGTGFLSVLRTKDLERKQPYIGTVPLITGHLAKDLTFYWLQSEQVPSAVGLAVNLDGNGKIESAGGFMLQALPGASPSELREIESQVHNLTNLAQDVAGNENPIHILSRIFQNTAFQILEEREVKRTCSCSWERVQRALTLVGADELTSMLEQDGQAVITCEFCCTEYRADREMLSKLIAQARN